MGNLTLKDLAYLAIICILAGFSVWEYVKQLDLESEIKRNEAKIDSLETKLSKCNPINNNITIGKIKGKGTAQIDQIIRLKTLDSLPFSTACDTLRVVEWFCKLPRRERNFYEKLSEKY